MKRSRKRITPIVDESLDRLGVIETALRQYRAEEA